MSQERDNFPDKKQANINFDRVTNFIKEYATLTHEADVGQETATFLAHGEYPNLPINIVYMTDIHYGNRGTDYDLLQEHFKIIEETPNTFVIFGGDEVDNFSPSKHPRRMFRGAKI